MLTILTKSRDELRQLVYNMSKSGQLQIEIDGDTITRNMLLTILIEGEW